MRQNNSERVAAGREEGDENMQQIMLKKWDSYFQK